MYPVTCLLVLKLAFTLSLCTGEPVNAPSRRGASRKNAAQPKQRRLMGEMLVRPSGYIPGGASGQYMGDFAQPAMMESLTEPPTLPPIIAPPPEPPTPIPTPAPVSPRPTAEPTAEPTAAPTPKPTPEPTDQPTPPPTQSPILDPTPSPVNQVTQLTWQQFGRDIRGSDLGDLFGSSVSLSGDGRVVAVGARNANADGAFNSGEVAVYDITPAGLWSRRGSFLFRGTANQEFGFSIDLTPNARILAVGSPSISGFGLRGSVQVYQWVDNFIWVPFGNILIGELNDEYGISVALSSDGRTLAVGAEDSDENGNNNGKVTVYAFDSPFWSQLGDPIQGQAANDVFGRSLAISSDGRSALAIGTGPLGGEYAKVFTFIDDAWIQLGQTLEGVAAQDRFGFSLSLSNDGSILAVGAYFNDDFERDAGSVYVYQIDDSSTWVLRGSPMRGEQVQDWFGWAVKLSGDGNVLIASSLGTNGPGGFKAGRSRVFRFVGNSWVQIGDPIDGGNPDDNSGASVAISEDGSVVAVGAPFNSDAAPRAGLVQVFQGISF